MSTGGRGIQFSFCQEKNIIKKGKLNMGNPELIVIQQFAEVRATHYKLIIEQLLSAKS